MKFDYPQKYNRLLRSLEVGFDPFGELDDGQLVSLIETLEDYFSMYGVNEAGDGESEDGTLCADLLTWLAKHDT